MADSNSKFLEFVETARPKVRSVKKVTGKVVRFIGKFLMVTVLVFCVVACVAGGYVGCKVLPMLDDYKQTAYEKFDSIGPNTFSYLSDTLIYDKDNNLISELNIGNYHYVTIDNVSHWVADGYIAVEDKRFKVHNGIDYKALVRAAVSIAKTRSLSQGGSTITQQVIKNNLLTQDKTLERKIMEFFIAPEFEKKYTKQEIMEFYVNTNFYGNNCYGIESASQYYFGKPASDLTLSEAALLVGMSNNASYYNPKTNYDETMRRRTFVLSEMLKENVITQEEYDEALSDDLELLYAREGRVKEDYMTSYAIHSAVLELMHKQGFEFKYLFTDEADYNDYQTRYDTLYNELSEQIRAGGYTIHTSLNPEIQERVQQIVDKNALSFSSETTDDGRYAFQTASVVVNNETGFVEAVVGGRGKEDEYNRGYMAKRQPGSSIKPLVVYTPAFSSGLYYPSLVMEDEDDPDDEYYPKNYGGNFLGSMSIREAVGRSTNTIAYQILRNLGANRGLEYLAAMRFDTMSNVDNNNTAVALGGFTYGVRVVDMAKGFSTLVNNGNYIDNTCILSIEYQNEGELVKEESELIPVYEPDAAYMMVDCCKTVLDSEYGTATNRNPENAIAFGKSGTTDDTKDAWFCGSSVYYSVAVWCGYDAPEETGLTGGSLPGRIWQQIMEDLHEDKPERDFERPETIVLKPINTNGTMANRDTGEYDIFSQALLDKAEAERQALLEKKKIDADNQLIGEIDTGLYNLRNYVITDIDSLTYLTSRFMNLRDTISTVYQEDQKTRLQDEILDIENYYAIDIRDMQAYNDRQERLKEVRKTVEKEKTLVAKLNELNDFVVLGRQDINAVEKLYSEIDALFDTVDDTAKTKYTSPYSEIKRYKEISLRPYRQQIEEEKRQERISAEALLQEYLSELDIYTRYSDDVEDVFDKIESQLEYCNEIGVVISDYYKAYNERKDEILLTKPRPIPTPTPQRTQTPTPTARPSVRPTPKPNDEVGNNENTNGNIGEENSGTSGVGATPTNPNRPIPNENNTNIEGVVQNTVMDSSGLDLG